MLTKYKLVYYTSNFIIMYFDLLILEDVNHTLILFVYLTERRNSTAISCQMES